MRGRLETALANMSDSITWTIPGNRDVSGSRQGKAAMRQLFGDVHGMFPQGLKVDFHQLHTTDAQRHRGNDDPWTGEQRQTV